MDQHHSFHRALLGADPERCAELLAAEPQLATEGVRLPGDSGARAHPLILLAQWPSRAPHYQADDSFADRVLACAQSLFSAACDLSLPALENGSASCADALLSRMAMHRGLDSAWGIEPRPTPESMIMQASLSRGGEASASAARAWLKAASLLGDKAPEETHGFKHFMALALSLSERSDIHSCMDLADSRSAALRL